ncbi:Hpt domain-containing protein [Salinispira pacifica]
MSPDAYGSSYHIESFRERYSNSPGIFEQVLGIFVRETPPKLEQLKAAHESGDRLQAAKAAHSLANAAGAVRAVRTLRLARELEAELKSDDLNDDLDAMVYALIREANGVLSVMLDYVRAEDSKADL